VYKRKRPQPDLNRCRRRERALSPPRSTLESTAHAGLVSGNRRNTGNKWNTDDVHHDVHLQNFAIFTHAICCCINSPQCVHPIHEKSYAFNYCEFVFTLQIEKMPTPLQWDIKRIILCFNCYCCPQRMFSTSRYTVDPKFRGQSGHAGVSFRFALFTALLIPGSNR